MTPSPVAVALAKLLPPDSAREAVDAIRGYEWQRWLTVDAWLALREGEALFIEWGEDFTVVSRDGVRTIQAKARAAKLTLGAESSRALISRAFVGAPGVRTLLWTSAEPGTERGKPFGEPGVRHWSQVGAGLAEPERLRTFLLDPGRLSPAAQALVLDADEDGFRALLGRVSWITGEADIAGLRGRAELATGARVQAVTGLPSLSIRRAAVAERLLARVADVGLRPKSANRRLTAVDLDRVILEENLEALAAAAPIIQGLNTNDAASALGQALLARVNRLRRKAGFQAPGDDPMLEWRDLGGDLLAGKYDAAPGDALLEALARTAWALAEPSPDNPSRALIEKAALGRSTETLRLARLSVESFTDPDAVLRTLRDDSSPEALGVQLITIARTRDWEKALSWAKPRRASDFSSIGAFHILMQLELAGRWNEALAFSDHLTIEQKASRPFLHLLRGFALMADVLQPEHAARLLEQPSPLNASEFRRWFKRDSPRLRIRLAAAQTEFRDGEMAASALDLPSSQHLGLLRDLATWVELENPDTFAVGRERLLRRLSGSEQFSSTVAFCAAYGVEFDQTAARQQFESRLQVGGIDVQDFRALSALYHDPADRLGIVDDHASAMAKFLGEPDFSGFRVELLLKADRLDEAEAALSQVEAAWPDDANLGRLRAALNGERGQDVSGAMRAIFEKTGETDDLRNLCLALGREKRWPALAEASQTLARLTRSEEHIGWMCNGYARARMIFKIVEALDEFASEVAASPVLRATRIDALLTCGRFEEARPALEALVAVPGRDDPDDDERLLRLSIESGAWEAGGAIVERVWERRAHRPSRKLAEAATLAMDRGLEGRARDLAGAAVAAKGAVAATYLTVWLVASALGHEADWPESADWFQRALDLSGPKGPVQSATMQQVADILPKQRRQHSETSDRVARGEVPLFAVADALSIPLADLVLGSALRNRVQPDPRRRWMIPNVRGARPPVGLGDVKSIALDLTTLMVLQVLGGLPATLERFDVVLPAGTLRALFQDQQMLRIHAPRQAKAAQQVLQLVGAGRLLAVPIAPSKDVDLVARVGESLADLLDHARGRGMRVCHPAPVHRPGSLSMEEVDMGAHMDVLASTQQLAGSVLRGAGMARPAFGAATLRLSRLDRDWAGAAPLGDDQSILLDDLALRYLQLSGLLEPAIEACGPLSLSSTAVEAARDEVALGRMAETLFAQIDALRLTLRDGMIGGRVRVAPAAEKRRRKEDHPTLQLFTVEGVDAYAIDDRYINGFGQIAAADGPRPVATSLDIIEELGAGALSRDAVLAAAADFLRCGFFFAPLTEQRLLADLAAAVDGEAFGETAELRAVREYVLRLQLLTNSVLPQEADYFEGVRRSFCNTLHRWWNDAPNLAAARAGADWIVGVLPDPRTFSRVWQAPPAPDALEVEYIKQLVQLACPKPMAAARMEAFRSWSEEAVLRPLADERPDLLERVAEAYALLLLEVDRIEDADA